MRKAVKVLGRQRIWRGVLTLALVMLIGLFADGFAIVSHAQSQGRVTANSANIRKEPNTSSEVVGSAVKDKEITINNQVEGSDGKIWYQIIVDANTLGYIRSDLVEITDGTTPPTVTPITPTDPGTTASGNVEALNPVSATVKGGNSVRIRSGASTSNDIVTTVSNGLVLTVKGRSSDSSGKVWYQVSFSDNGSEVEGFIREDYVTISGELTPYVEEPVVDEPPVETDPEPVDPEPVVNKAYDTALIDGDWYLLDYENNRKQKIDEIIDKVEENAKAYETEHKKAESEKVVIIILIFLLVAAASGIAMLIFKIKDMSDDAYFSQVERETLRRRGEVRTQSSSQKVMHTVGTDKSVSGRPAGGRPSGAPQGQKTAGERPAGTRPAGARPSGAPQGQKTVGERPTGTRPSGAPQGQKTAGERPSGSAQGQRPAESQQGSRPSETSRESGSADNRQGQSGSGQKPAQGQPGWQTKNFMSEEDDEFEFGFLNYDGTEEK